MFDFGSELPAWFEVDADDLSDSILGGSGGSITFGVGEYDAAWQTSATGHKAGTPVKYTQNGSWTNTSVGTTYRPVKVHHGPPAYMCSRDGILLKCSC